MTGHGPRRQEEATRAACRSALQARCKAGRTAACGCHLAGAAPHRLYDPLADEKGLTLRVDVDAAAPMHGNRELVTQALANLVDNAIKYGGRGESAANGVPAEIAVRAASEGDLIRLSVA